MDTTYTRIGGELPNWAPLRACSPRARWLWIALYLSHRRVIPGLWVAGIPTIADVAKMTPDDTLAGLDELIGDRDLIEYDRNREVLRLTEFPDRGERPMNGSHIRSLFTRFRTVPDCQVRNAHVRTLEWLLQDPYHPPKADHVKAWEETFGLIPVPAPRKRGCRRLLDSDTGTSVQPSLFTNEGETVSITTKTDTVSPTVSTTHRSTIYDPRSLSSSGEESTSRAKPGDQEQISLPRPQLGLVPLPDDLPFSIGDMLAAIASQSEGRFPDGPMDDRLVDALVATIRACQSSNVQLDDLRLVGRWLANGGLSYRTDLGPVWLARPGNLLDAVGQARVWRERGELRMGARGRVVPSVEPSPSSAFTNGRKVLR